MYLPLLIITLNLVPAEVPELSLQLATIEQGQGNLDGILGGAPLELVMNGPIQSFARKGKDWVNADKSKKQVVRVKGVECVVTSKRGVKTHNLTHLLGVKEKPHWKGLQRIQTPQLQQILGPEAEQVLGIRGPLEIQRKPNGVNFLLQRGKGKVLLGRATWKLGD